MKKLCSLKSFFFLLLALAIGMFISCGDSADENKALESNHNGTSADKVFTITIEATDDGSFLAMNSRSRAVDNYSCVNFNEVYTSIIDVPNSIGSSYFLYERSGGTYRIYIVHHVSLQGEIFY